MMQRTPLNYAQPTHPEEAAARHIPDYEAGRPKGIPNALVWLILFLFAVGYCVILPAVSQWLR